MINERPIDPVTLDEAALILGCSRASVRRLIASGQLLADRKGAASMVRVCRS